MTVKTETENAKISKLHEQQSATDELAGKGLLQLYFDTLDKMKNNPLYEGVPLHFLKVMLSEALLANFALLNPNTIDQLEMVDDTVPPDNV